MNRRGGTGAVLLVVLCGLIALAGVGLVGTATADGPPDPGEYDDLLEGMDGNGSEASPYVITNVSELQAIAGDLDAHYVLGNDIDASATEEWHDGQGFNPIGTFQGSLDGNEYAISGLTIVRNQAPAGFFSATSSHAEIRNITFKRAHVEAGQHIAVVVGQGSVIIEQVHVRDSHVEKSFGASTGSISDEVGGIIGISSSGQIIESSVERTNIVNPGGDDTGGLVGDLNNGQELKRSYTKDVSVVCSLSCGGVVGELDGNSIVEDTYSLNIEITDLSGGSAGGLVGEYDSSSTSIETSYAAEGTVGGGGGLVANSGTSINNYWESRLARSSGEGQELPAIDMVGDAAKANMEGFDFNNTWAVEEGFQMSYPYLIDNPPDSVRTYPESFSIDITDITDPVAVGETLEVTAAVWNLNDRQDTQPVGFEINGQELNATNVTLGSGESTTVNFEWEADDRNSAGVRVTTRSHADSTTVDVRNETEPANFAVELNETTPAVAPGETIEVSADIENIGDLDGTRSVSFDVNGQEVTATNVTLGSGENETVTFTWETDEDDQGSAGVRISSGDDVESTTVSIRDETDPANFDVEIDELPDTVTAGESIDVNATIENTGDLDGTRSVSFDVNGQEVTATNVTLGSGENETVSFTWETDKDDQGSAGVRVSSGDDADNTNIGLTPADEETGEAGIEIVGANTPVSEGDVLEVDVEITNTGDAELTQDIDFDVDAQREETREVTVGPDETTVETFTWEADNRNSVGLRAAGEDGFDNSFLLLADADFTPSGL